MDLGSFGVGLLLGILGLDFPPNNKFPDIVLLGQSEEFADFAGPFRSKSFRVSDIGKAREIRVTLFDNDNG